MANNYKKGDHDTRPWGTWEVLDAGDTFCVKKITVTPGNILSKECIFRYKPSTESKTTPKKIWCLLKFRPVIIWMKMTSSAMRTLTVELKIIKFVDVSTD